MVAMFPNNLTSTTSSSATSSGYESSYYPWQAFDGNDSTRWGPNGQPSTSSPKWLQRDLGKAYKIDHVVVNFLSQSECFTQGSLQGSNDNSTFTDIATYSLNSSTTLTLNVTDDTPYRYIRLVTTGYYSGWGKVTEMQIYVNAESNPGTRIQLRHDTATNWSLVNPVLLDGEVGLETDTNQMKMGNGVDDWNTLEYAGPQIDPSAFLTNTATGTGALTILGTATTSANCVNIGTSSKATSYTQPGVAVGYNAKVNDANGIAIGNTITASNCGDYGIGIGRNITLQRNSICVGYNANSSMENSICIGNSASVSVYSSSYTSYPSVALGYIADSRWGSVTIGSVAKGYSENGIAIGNGAQSGYQNGSNRNTANIAIGRNAKCNTSGMGNEYGTAIGSGAEVTGKAAIQLGFGSNTTDNTFSVGFLGQNSNTPYTLLNGTTGLIPVARVPKTISMPFIYSSNTLPASGSSITTSATGYLYIKVDALSPTPALSYVQFVNTTLGITMQQTIQNGIGTITLMIPYRDGDSLTINYDGIDTSTADFGYISIYGGGS